VGDFFSFVFGAYGLTGSVTLATFAIVTVVAFIAIETFSTKDEWHHVYHLLVDPSSRPEQERKRLPLRTVYGWVASL